MFSLHANQNERYFMVKKTLQCCEWHSSNFTKKKVTKRAKKFYCEWALEIHISNHINHQNVIKLNFNVFYALSNYNYNNTVQIMFAFALFHNYRSTYL